MMELGIKPIKTCCGIVIDENNSQIDMPPGGPEQTLATVTITVNDPASTVRLMASVYSGHLAEGQNRVVFRIRRADNSIVRSLANNDFDQMTTTFFAFDNPGQGTFTYTLVASNNFADTTEIVFSSIFTAEELSVL